MIVLLIIGIALVLCLATLALNPQRKPAQQTESPKADAPKVEKRENPPPQQPPPIDIVKLRKVAHEQSVNLIELVNSVAPRELGCLSADDIENHFPSLLQNPELRDLADRVRIEEHMGSPERLKELHNKGFRLTADAYRKLLEATPLKDWNGIKYPKFENLRAVRAAVHLHKHKKWLETATMEDIASCPFMNDHYNVYSEQGVGDRRFAELYNEAYAKAENPTSKLHLLQWGYQRVFSEGVNYSYRGRFERSWGVHSRLCHDLLDQLEDLEAIISLGHISIMWFDVNRKLIASAKAKFAQCTTANELQKYRWLCNESSYEHARVVFMQRLSEIS